MHPVVLAGVFKYGARSIVAARKEMVRDSPATCAASGAGGLQAGKIRNANNSCKRSRILQFWRSTDSYGRSGFAQDHGTSTGDSLNNGDRQEQCSSVGTHPGFLKLVA